MQGNSRIHAIVAAKSLAAARDEELMVNNHIANRIECLRLLLVGIEDDDLWSKVAVHQITCPPIGSSET